LSGKVDFERYRDVTTASHFPKRNEVWGTPSLPEVMWKPNWMEGMLPPGIVTPRVKTVWQFAITATLALVIAFCVPVFVHRGDYDARVLKWERNRTPENEGALKSEVRKNDWIALRTHLEAAGTLFLLLNTFWFLGRQLDKRRRLHG
jgi:hypothetical protein